jgi:phosphoserine phosphatase RsbU/P
MSEQPVVVSSDRIRRVIFDYATRIAQEQDEESLLRLNADLARDLCGADRCSLWLIDTKKNELWTKVAHGVAEIRVPAGTGLVGACVQSGEFIVVNDTSKDPRFTGRSDKKSGYETQSVLVMPLRGQNGTVIGAIQALNKPGGFNDDDDELLGLAAAYAARVVENQRNRKEAESAKLLYRELEIARSVQQQLLPQRLPEIQGLELGAFFRPAKFVGGDYYDFLPLNGNSLAVTQGDVSGKGVAAAVLMAGLQTGLASLFAREPESVAAVMGDFNRSVHSRTPPDKYTTLFCGVYDGNNRTLRYVNAGHVPPFLVRRGDGTVRVERLPGGGLPLGLLPMAKYEDEKVQLRPGDEVFVFSDGISEATNANDDIWEEAQLDAAVLSASGKSAVDAAQSLADAADVFADGAEQADDMTLVVLRVL